MNGSRGIKFYTVLLFFLTACGGSNRFDIDVSGVQAKVKFTDWNKTLESKNASQYLALMKKTSAELYKYYLGSMIRVDPANDSLSIRTLDMFMYYPSTVESVKEIDRVFGNFEPYKKEIELAFQHVKYHYPETPEINVITYNTGFNFGVFPVENEIGLGLEMYLGKDNKVVRALPTQKFPQYMKNNMEPANLLVDMMRGYAAFKLIPESEGTDLLNAMINEGKALYALDAFLPGKEDHVKIRYSKEQLDWCFQYERQIWKEIIDHKWLYDSNVKVISEFVNEAPFTGSLPQNSPPRAGAWLGWQMVRAYANDHSDLSLKQILEEKDARKILRSYKPPK
jgi:hypothetical protein